MNDQLIGGLIMWIPGGLFFFVDHLGRVFPLAAARRRRDSTAGAQVDWKAV